jgi:hypothetical protein
MVRPFHATQGTYRLPAVAAYVGLLLALATVINL